MRAPCCCPKLEPCGGTDAVEPGVGPTAGSGGDGWTIGVPTTCRSCAGGAGETSGGVAAEACSGDTTTGGAEYSTGGTGPGGGAAHGVSMRILDGTGDVVSGEAHLALKHRAEAYARAYNAALSDWLRTHPHAAAD